MTPILWRIVFALSLLTAGFGAGWKLSADHKEASFGKERQTWANAIVEGQAEVLRKTNVNDILKTRLGVQHNEANAALNVLLSHPAPRVQLPKTCLPTTTSTQTIPTSGVPVQTTSSERTSDTAQVSFDNFRQGLESDAIEWSAAIENCRAVMIWSNAK